MFCFCLGRTVHVSYTTMGTGSQLDFIILTCHMWLIFAFQDHSIIMILNVCSHIHCTFHIYHLVFFYRQHLQKYIYICWLPYCICFVDLDLQYLYMVLHIVLCYYGSEHCSLFIICCFYYWTRITVWVVYHFTGWIFHGSKLLQGFQT